MKLENMEVSEMRKGTQHLSRVTRLGASGIAVGAVLAGAGGNSARAESAASVPDGAVSFGLPPISVALPEAGPGGSAVILSEQQRIAFRQDFGLPTDQASLDAAERADVSNRYGLPLSEAELQDVAFQQSVDSAVSNATTVLDDEFPTTFENVSVDHAAGGVVTVAFAGAPPKADFSALFPQGTEVQTSEVANSLQVLRTAQDELSDELVSGGFTVAGTPIEETWLDLDSGMIDVAVARDHADSATIVYKTLAETYPVHVVVGDLDEQEMVDATNTNLASSGGESIVSQSGTEYCSTGFAVQVGSGSKGMLTAGHCDGGVANSDYWYTDYPDHNGVGFNVASAWTPTADAEILGWTNPSAKVYHPGSLHNLGYTVGWWDPLIASGVTIHETDGHDNSGWYSPQGAQFIDATIPEAGGHSLEHSESAGLCAHEGTSGSPIYTDDDVKDGYVESSAGGIVATAAPINGTCGVDAIRVVWSSIYYDDGALGAVPLTAAAP